MAYSFQSFSVGEVFTAAKASQIEVNIRDHVHGISSVSDKVNGRVVRTAGNITTTSTSLVDATGATVTFTTNARPILAGCSMTSFTDAAGQLNYFNVNVDGTLLNGTDGVGINFEAGNVFKITSFSVQSAALTAASHTAKLQWRTSAGTGSIAATTGTNFVYWAQEI